MDLITEGKKKKQDLMLYSESVYRMCECVFASQSRTKELLKEIRHYHFFKEPRFLELSFKLPGQV